MRGQISLEMILTAVVAIIAVASLTLVIEGIQEMQSDASIRHQLNSIGLEVSSMLSASTVLDDAEIASFEMDIPSLRVLGEENLQECEIEIVNPAMGDPFLRVTEPNSGVFVEVPFIDPRPAASLNPAMTSDQKAKCGDSIRVNV